MIDHFCSPWLGDAKCPACGGEMSVSRFDESSAENVFTHHDSSVPDCRVPSTSASMRADGAGIRFAFQFGAEFHSLDDAIEWARRRVEAAEDEEVNLGYVQGHDGHRVIGALKESRSALAVVSRCGGSIVVDRPTG